MSRRVIKRLHVVCLVSATVATCALWPGQAFAQDAEKTGNGSQPSEVTSQKPIQVADTVITGTWTPHAQKDSPVEIERITGKMLEQAGATNVRQVLQDVGDRSSSNRGPLSTISDTRPWKHPHPHPGQRTGTDRIHGGRYVF